MAVGVIAAHFARSGKHVVLPAVRYAPTWEERFQYADDGDLWVCSETPSAYKGGLPLYNPEQRYEIKHLWRQEFTCLKDWDEQTFIVCAKRAWDKAKPKPTAFIFLNRRMTHFAIVRGSTADQWEAKERWNFKGTPNAFKAWRYICPLELVEWRELDPAEARPYKLA